MYLDTLPETLYTSTLVRIKYDCHGEERQMKWCDAKKNFEKNGGKHICRPCWLRSDDNPAKKKENQEKAKKTNLERYGSVVAMNTPENMAARIEKMFGTEEAVKTIVEKRKATSQERYGADHIMKTDEGVNRVKKTMQQKHGVDFPLQSPAIMRKMGQTLLERYGVNNAVHLPEVPQKMKETTKEKYGVEHYNQLPEMREYLRKNCPEWMKECYENPWAKGIVRPQEWNQKQRESIRIRMQSGNWRGGYKSNYRGNVASAKCKKKNPRFISKLELIFHCYLILNEFVEWYDYEPFHIPYKDMEGKDHDYYPDFLVKYQGDPVLRIVETKTWRQKDSTMVKLKTEAAIEYADQNNMIYVIMFDEDVKNLGLTFEIAQKMPGIVFDNNRA